jgi:hypothetical protein
MANAIIGQRTLIASFDLQNWGLSLPGDRQIWHWGNINLKVIYILWNLWHFKLTRCPNAFRNWLMGNQEGMRTIVGQTAIIPFWGYWDYQRGDNWLFWWDKQTSPWQSTCPLQSPKNSLKSVPFLSLFPSIPKNHGLGFEWAHWFNVNGNRNICGMP